MNDTTNFLKNVERFERLVGRYGDSYAMSHHQNCNCPFALHHDFSSSADEKLVRSFGHARPDVSASEKSKLHPIKPTKYLATSILLWHLQRLTQERVARHYTGECLNGLTCI